VVGDTGVIAAAHAAGLVVHAFTFRNDSGLYGFSDPVSEYKAYYALGIDGVFSDFPDTALAAQGFARVIADLEALPIAGRGAEGIRRSLEQKLANAERHAARGAANAAAGVLRALIQQVQGLPGSRISAADRQQLTTGLNRVLNGL
jgi:hypothetical protein